MSKSIGAPNGIERRAYRTSDATVNNLPSVESTIQIAEGKPSKEISDRSYLVEMLQGQIDLALDRDYPLCLGLVRVAKETAKTEQAAMLLEMLRKNLRPTDIVLLMPGPTLAIILHEADLNGGRVVLKRIKKLAASAERTADLKIESGFSDRLTREPSRAETLLRTAERDLERVSIS